jgi:hypothetical protein
LDGVSVGSDVLDAEPDQITGAKLAVYSEVEESQVTEPAIKLQARADRPDVFRLERRLWANKLALVPGAGRRSLHLDHWVQT